MGIVSNVAANAKHFAQVAKFTARQKSPELLLVGAGILGAACVVTACRATLKSKPEIEEMQEKCEDLDAVEGLHIQANEAKEEPDDEGLKELSKQVRKEKRSIVAKTVFNVSKHYVPPVILGFGCVGCVLAAYKIMDKRLVAATVAYESVYTAFNRYRHKVIDKYGEKVDKQLYYGETLNRYEETEIDEDGKEHTVKRVEPNVEKDAPWFSVYSRVIHNRSRQTGMDVDQLRRLQNYWNDVLNTKGYVWLNDIYKDLGIDIDGNFCGIGWINPSFLGKEYEDYSGDGYIDFGLFGDHVSDQAKYWREGKTDSVILDFNVDGPVYHLVNMVIDNYNRTLDEYTNEVMSKNKVNRRPYYPHT